MPLINVKLIDGVFSPTQKKQIAQKLTEAMVSIEGVHRKGSGLHSCIIVSYDNAAMQVE